MDEEKRSRVAEHENIENKVGRSKISKTHKKEAINKLQQGQAVVQNTSSCMQNGWNTQGNILEETAREMVKECGRDEHVCK